MLIGSRQVEEVRFMVEQVKAVRVYGVDAIAGVDVTKGGDRGTNIGHIRRLVRLVVEERLVVFRRHIFVENFKLVVVCVPEKLPLDDVRKSVDDAVVISTPHLNAVTTAWGNMTEDLYLNEKS